MSPVRKRRVGPAEALANRRRIDARKMALDAERFAATAALVGFDYLRGDLHTHSLWSDGWGSVAENAEVAATRGLDFFFATDHATIRQKLECAPFKNVWWGQEPGAGPHHICMLLNERRFVPEGDIAADAEALRSQGVFFFYPHPTGWFPNCYYTPEQTASLEAAGRSFAIEVINGIFRSEPFHDPWVDSNVALWDGYLARGFRVTGLGASDAHMPATVGTAWTGVVGARLDKDSVVNVLRTGRAFASTGPVMNIEAAGAKMGGAARSRPASGGIEVRLECADSYGLAWARLVVDGRVAKEIDCRGKERFADSVKVKAGPRARYVRAECAALDDRRAYGNPVYFAPDA